MDFKSNKKDSIADVIENNAYSKNIKEKSVETVVSEMYMMKHLIFLLKEYLFYKLKESDKTIHSLVKNLIITQKLVDFDNINTLIPFIKYEDYVTPLDLIEKKLNPEDINNMKNLMYQIIMSYKKNPYIAKPGNLIYIFDKNVIKFQYGSIMENMSKKRYDKLQNFYKNKHEMKVFNERVFKMMIRNGIIDFHMGLCTKIFELLSTELSVNFELFSSPLNNYFKDYCSAYTDTDIYFGSQGNFFDVYPALFKNGGSFEAFPPRNNEYLSAFSTLVCNELEKNISALSFFIVIPHIPETYACSILSKSKFTNYKLMNKAQRNNEKESKCTNQKLTIFILQNNLGKEKYKVTEEFINKLELCFE